MRSSSAPQRSACSTKYPPKHSHRHDTLPKRNSDGGCRVIFGRSPGLVYPPTGWHPQHHQRHNPGLPDRNLKRDYVFGYNGSIKRSVHFISETEIVYPVAALVVVAKLHNTTQSHFEGHHNDVTCIDWSACRKLCASGQQDQKGTVGAYICIWSPDDIARTISQLHYHSRMVSAVAFSNDGHTLVSFGGDDACTFCVWRHVAADQTNTMVEQKAPAYTISSGRQLTTGIFVDPKVADDWHMLFHTVGHRHFKFWTVILPRSGGADLEVVQRLGVRGPRNPQGLAHSSEPGVAWLVGDDGHIYVMHGATVTGSVAITRQQVGLGCIASLPGDRRWAAGANDGCIYIGCADPSPRVEQRLAFDSFTGADSKLFISTTVPMLSHIVLHGDWAIFATSNHSLVHVNLIEQKLMGVLQVSHAEEAWALDFHPKRAVLATGSTAKDIRFWNTAARRPAVGKIMRTTYGVWSLAFSTPEGYLLAAGCDSGFLEVMTFPALQHVYRDSLSKVGERIVDLRFSKNGALLAAACWDQAVYLLSVTGADPEAVQVRLHRVLSGNSSSPICVLFSDSGEFVMTNSKDMQVLVWCTKDGARQPAISAFRDTVWQNPWTCVIGWPVIGVWSDPNYDFSDINTLCQSKPPFEDYVAIGDDVGQVKLFRFPCPFVDAAGHVHRGHGSHVTRVKFSHTNVLASLGGDDHSIALWSLCRTDAHDVGQAASRRAKATSPRRTAVPARRPPSGRSALRPSSAAASRRTPSAGVKPDVTAPLTRAPSTPPPAADVTDEPYEAWRPASLSPAARRRMNDLGWSRPIRTSQGNRSSGVASALQWDD